MPWRWPRPSRRGMRRGLQRPLLQGLVLVCLPLALGNPLLRRERFCPAKSERKRPNRTSRSAFSDGAGPRCLNAVAPLPARQYVTQHRQTPRACLATPRGITVVAMAARDRSTGLALSLQHRSRAPRQHLPLRSRHGMVCARAARDHRFAAPGARLWARRQRHITGTQRASDAASYSYSHGLPTRVQDTSTHFPRATLDAHDICEAGAFCVRLAARLHGRQALEGH